MLCESRQQRYANACAAIIRLREYLALDNTATFPVSLPTTEVNRPFGESTLLQNPGSYVEPSIDRTILELIAPRIRTQLSQDRLGFLTNFLVSGF